MAFTEKELDYLRSQPLARLATVDSDGQPDNAAVTIRVAQNGVIVISGMNMARSRKGRNVHAGNQKVALLVDDLETVDPWRPRGIRIYGTAELQGAEVEPPSGGRLKVTPEISWSWGIESAPAGASGFTTHRTEH